MDVEAWTGIIAAWPNDWILIGGVTVLVALDALRSGSARAVSLALSLPATLFVMNAIPESFFLGPLVATYTAPVVQIVLFLIVLTLLFWATYRTVFSASDGGQVLQSLIIGMAASAALVIVWIQVPGLEYLWHFGDQVQAAFAPAYRFWWLVGVFLALAFARS
jgi:cation transport ATPase